MSDSRTSLHESILGAWTLSSYVIADVSGENREYPLGEDARGVLIYTADGFMSVQIGKPGRPPRREVASAMVVCDGPGDGRSLA